jgi:DNA-binding Lrp family transcriptional regulator
MAGLKKQKLRALDALDGRILEALSKDAWLTYAALSRRVHLSPSAVQRRVERLIREGVLLGATARIAGSASIPTLRIFALIELLDERSATLSNFIRRLRAAPVQVDAHYVAGAYDLVLIIQVESMAQYAEFAKNYLNGSTQVRRFKTLTELQTIA